jgi:hypothetical protein
MHLHATTTDTISITLPDGSVVSATGEAWLKWLICGKELLDACELGLGNIESPVKTPSDSKSVSDRIRSAIEKVTLDGPGH